MAQALPKSFNRAVLDSLFYAIEKENVTQIGNLCEGRHPLQVNEIARIITPLLKGKPCTPEKKQIWKTKILRMVQGPPEGREREAPSSTNRIFQISVIVEKTLTFFSYKELEDLATVSHVFHRASLRAHTLQMHESIKKSATLSLTPETVKDWVSKHGVPFEQVFKEYIACASSVTSVEIDPAFLCERYIPVLQTYFSHAARLFLSDRVRKKDLNDILTCFTKLEHFEISAGIPKQYLTMTVAALEAHSKGLNSISLIDCNDATDDIIRLAFSFPKIRRVILTDCSDLNDKALITLAQYCPELETFCVPGSPNITDESVLALVHSNRKLKEIDVSECQQLTAGPLCKLIEHSKDSLESVNLEAAKNVEIAPIVSILTHCTHVTTINLAGHDITDEMIVPFIRSSPHLSSVNLSQCTKITEKTFSALADHCLKLTRVDVSESFISDEGLGLLASLPFLVYLNIFECASLTNKGIISFCARKSNLLSLNSGRCLDYQGSFAIANFCPRLEFLFVDHMVNKIFLSAAPYLKNELLYNPVTPWGKLLQLSLRSLLTRSEEEIDAAKSQLQHFINGLTQEDRALIYYYVWQFNGSPDELEWGEKNALRDLYKFNASLRHMFIHMHEVQRKDGLREIEYELADVPHIPFRKWRKESRYLEVRRTDALYLITHSISDKGL